MLDDRDHVELTIKYPGSKLMLFTMSLKWKESFTKDGVFPTNGCSNQHVWPSRNLTRSGIDRVRAQIERHTYKEPPQRLVDEVAHWECRLKEFYQIAGQLIQLKNEQEDVTKQEEIYNSMQTTELPGSKRQCWLNMGKNFAERKKLVKERIIEAASLLMTFFAIKGNDHMLYTGDIGWFYLDEYNHQVYAFDHGMSFYHVNCEGDLKQVSEKDVPFFDSHGRYIITPEGEKVYQCAPCTSTYKLGEDGLLEKTTKDCGHSEKLSTTCQMHLKDMRGGEILPDVKKMDIKKTLDPEVVKYLWDSFGHVLPFALHDVGLHPTKNPIHNLAHKLLLHKYNKTKSQMKKKIDEAQEYRANIFQERKDKEIASTKTWRAKQVKRRKPEESYNTEDQIVYDDAKAQQMFQAMINYMND